MVLKVLTYETETPALTNEFPAEKRKSRTSVADLKAFERCVAEYRGGECA
jgi:hypothetical protein